MPSSFLPYLLVAALSVVPAASAADTPLAAAPDPSGLPATPASPEATSADPGLADPAAAQTPAHLGAPVSPVGFESAQGSTYIPLDSWVYPQMMRLYSMGYVTSAFIGMRPWTRASVQHMLDLSADEIYNSEDDQAIDIYRAVRQYLEPGRSLTGNTADKDTANIAQLSTVYTRLMGIGGTPLRDSYHVGQTIVNDYGRPYTSGFNNISGFSTISQYGRFSLEFRGEYQYSPSANGYTFDQAQTLLVNDQLGVTAYNPTIPFGPIPTANHFRVQEANAAVLLAGHEVSFGKSDDWWGPGIGGGMGYSNNAEDIYNFRINRVEPLYIPFVSKILGPVRYEFLIGSLKGHTAPNTDYTHTEGFSFKPTDNFEFGFQRTGGLGRQGS